MPNSINSNLPVILAVDDMPMNLRIVKVFLDKQFTVIPAKNGTEAIAILKAKKIDLILLDIEMPGMSGFDVLEELHKLPSKTGVPVICVTGIEPTPEFITKVLHSGAQDFICKPFDQKVLQAKVCKAISINIDEVKD
jgi:putative two-component system response regulator